MEGGGKEGGGGAYEVAKAGVAREDVGVFQIEERKSVERG